MMKVMKEIPPSHHLQHHRLTVKSGQLKA